MFDKNIVDELAQDFEALAETCAGLKDLNYEGFDYSLEQITALSETKLKELLYAALEKAREVQHAQFIAQSAANRLRGVKCAVIVCEVLTKGGLPDFDFDEAALIQKTPKEMNELLDKAGEVCSEHQARQIEGRIRKLNF